MDIEKAITEGIVFKGGKSPSGKQEDKVKTKAKKKSYITGLHGSGAAKMKAEFDLDKEADAIENAVKQVLKEGYRTIDIMPQAGESTEGIKQVGTAKMGDLIAERV